jgi:hypothetical protein
VGMGREREEREESYSIVTPEWACDAVSAVKVKAAWYCREHATRSPESSVLVGPHTFVSFFPSSFLFSRMIALGFFWFSEFKKSVHLLPHQLLTLPPPVPMVSRIMSAPACLAFGPVAVRLHCCFSVFLPEEPLELWATGTSDSSWPVTPCLHAFAYTSSSCRPDTFYLCLYLLHFCLLSCLVEISAVMLRKAGNWKKRGSLWRKPVYSYLIQLGTPRSFHNRLLCTFVWSHMAAFTLAFPSFT